MDINPFLVWLAKAKTAQYSDKQIESSRTLGNRAIQIVKSGTITPVQEPQIHNIERWWCADAREFLCSLKSAIDVVGEIDSSEHNLLLAAFCRTLIGLSNAAFNHQSLSFKNACDAHAPLHAEMELMFIEDLQFVLDGAKNNPPESSKVVRGDARNMMGVTEGSFDLVITSPPYANRMSYIRELRPYMYWLGFLGDGRDAGEMDWSSIGGTWGAATSRLKGWKQPEDAFLHSLLGFSLHKIAQSKNKNGEVMAKYIAKYFNDVWEHINALTPILEQGGKLNYIVGNSTFYGVLLSVEQIYAAMFEQLGFKDVQYRAIRKRNSNKDLYEFNVSAHW